jgi:hypothetical protein
MDLNNIYKNRLATFQEQQAKKGKRIWNIGTARLVLFVAMVYCLVRWFGSEFEAQYYVYILAGLIPVFVVLLRLHQTAIDEKMLLDQLVLINEKELAAQENHQAQFDGGIELQEPIHDFNADLDLFGESGLFAHLNRTATVNGKRSLAQLLQHPLNNTAEIEEQQQSIKVLAPLLEFRQAFLAQGFGRASSDAPNSKDAVSDSDYLQQWAETPPAFINNTLWKIIRVVMPILGIGTLLYWMLASNFLPFLGIIIVNGALLSLRSKYVGQEHTLLGKRQDILRLYVALLQLTEVQNFDETAQLRSIRQAALDAKAAFKKLSAIVGYFDQRLNIFVGLGLNLVALYDIHCLFALEHWKEANKDSLGSWLERVAELDALLSLATFYYNHPTFTFPQVKKSEQLYITAKQMGHPLIDPAVRIDNDVNLGHPQQVYVVTGSNMAGKSTFLRCVAINLLLAKCGAPVCAQQFECALMDIKTSMRVQDSINAQTSYFQAELLRLQYIIEELKKGHPTFIILDEILKGTNSEDKLLGSQLLVRYFLQFKALAMVATHDLELGDLQEELPEQVANLCFESTIQNDELDFDYQLNSGIAKNKNATFLMKKMGIVPREMLS